MNNKGSLETHRMCPGIGLTNGFCILVYTVITERWPRIGEQEI